MAVCDTIWLSDSNGTEISKTVSNTSIGDSISLPGLSFCIQQTLLIWTPTLYLVIAFPFLIFTTPKRRGIVPFSVLNVSKQVVSFAMLLTCLVSLGYSTYKHINMTHGETWHSISAPVLQIISMLVVIFCTEFERRVGVRSSGFQLVFWILTSLSGLLTLWSLRVLLYWEVDVLYWVISCLFYGAAFIQLVLSSVIDQLPVGGEEKITDYEVPNPVFSRSSFIRLFLLFPFRIIKEGFKKTITIDDLWSLQSQYEARESWQKLKKNWNQEIQKSYKSGVREKTRYHSQSDHPLLPVNQQAALKKDVKNCTRMLYKPSLLKAILKSFSVFFFLNMILRGISEVFIFTSPLILRRIIHLVETGDEAHQGEGYFYAGLLFLLAISEAILTNHLQKLHFHTNIKARSAVMCAIYSKALKLSSYARRFSTLGEIVNLMAVDSFKYVELMNFINMTWVLPIQVGCAMYFLWELLGPASLAGVAAFCCMAPLKFILTRANKKLQAKQMKYKDNRIKLTNEILSGIKVLKLYAWEKSFESQVKELRQKELRIMQLQALLSSAIHFIFNLGPFLIALVSFAVFVMSSENNILTAEVAFVSLAYFNILRTPLQQLPVLINNLIQAVVSHHRIYNFLLKEELEENCVIHQEAEPGVPICISDGSFTWDPTAQPLLKNIDLSVREGSLTAIVGTVGAGKSSLLSAMLGEMQKVSGKLHMKGSVAYVPQQAWIQQTTLKNNVLFHKEYDEARYQKVLEDCALMPDLDILPGRDETEIGEKGINLSGGQKLRVSLARAVYQLADIYLLDDPLSAVDAHVGKTIFENILGPNGHLSKKTRIIVSHSLWFLPFVDEIFVLEEGMITERGSYESLLERQGVFAELIQTYENTTANDTMEQVTDDVSQKTPGLSSVLTEDQPINGLPPTHNNLKATEFYSHPCLAMINSASSEHKLASRPLAQRVASMHDTLLHNRSLRSLRASSLLTLHNSTASEIAVYCASQTSMPGSNIDLVVTDKVTEEGSPDGNDEADIEVKMTDKEKGELVVEEQVERGKVKLSVYTTYLRAVGLLSGILMVMISILTVCFNLGASVWLSNWSDTVSESRKAALNFTHSDTNISTNLSINSRTNFQDVNQNYYLAVYGTLGFFQAVGSAARYGLGMYAGLRTSRVQHKNLLRSVLRAPMVFFDRTPLGRILNRFSGDVATMDSNLPVLWITLVTMVFDALGTMVLIGVVTPWSFIAWLCLGIVFIFILMFYVATQRQTQRLLSINRSPVYAHFDESLSGMSTIRAYRLQDVFLKKCQQRIDQWGRCVYFSVCCNRWLGVTLNMIGSVVVLLSAIMVITFRHSLSSGLVGLALTYALTITGVLQMLVRQCAMVESQIVSVERIVQYLALPHEAPWLIEEQTPVASWPHEGAVQVRELEMRYREGLDLVLKGVTFSLKPAEKIGVVGRTGAGKSSLTLALFRIIEASHGSIYIDGVNIADIGLHDLRGRLTIIPQDPVLFSATLRLNLDPFNAFTDDQVWQSLEQAHLSAWVRSLPEGLQYKCSEGGGNLSIGQRQLVCLARALLRHTRVLVMDEATAGCDVETDELIQSTIRQEFSDCTVITVAHRLHTIMDYDRIMVLKDGRIAELNTPSSLLADKESIFHSMAKDSGLVT